MILCVTLMTVPIPVLVLPYVFNLHLVWTSLLSCGLTSMSERAMVLELAPSMNKFSGGFALVMCMGVFVIFVVLCH